MALPKNHREKLVLRNKAIGNARRRENMCRILENSATFPKGVMLPDIDQAFAEWVEKKLYIEFDGEALPTFKLFSNQRISEYSQNWKHVDSLGNVLLNFKTISRENNPKKGNNQGSLFNIPGERDYVMGYKPILQENGTEAYDMYTMKQPYTLDLIYTISIITNKFELLNKMNQLVQHEFSALQSYLFPNGHAMPMKLEDVSDESEYAIDDRKYYSQSYKINLAAYIVDPSGFKITHLPSIIKIGLKPKGDKMKKPVKVSIEEVNECAIKDESPYEMQNFVINIEFPSCRKSIDFNLDGDLIIDEIEMNNVYDFVYYINDELQDFENNEIRMYAGDLIHIEIERDDPFADSKMIIKCSNPNVIYDTRINPESSLDERNFDMEIKIK